MKAAAAVEKENSTQQEHKKKQKQIEPLHLRETENANSQTQKPEDQIAAKTTPNSNRNRLFDHNGIPAVHGSQPAYAQGAELMYKKLQTSLEQTGDLNHPDTKKSEMDYKMTLGISELRDYHEIKTGTYIPKSATERQYMAEVTKSKAEETTTAKTPSTNVTQQPTTATKPAEIQEQTTSVEAIQPLQNSAVQPEVIETLDFPAEQETEVRTTPTSALSDPQFNKTIGSVKSTAKDKRVHTTKDKAEANANAAAAVPTGERKSKARGQQVEQLDEQKTTAFKAADFKAKLTTRINQMQLPKNEKEANNFEEHNNIAQVNQSAKGDVVVAKNNVTGSIETVAKQEPNEAKIAQRTATALPDPKIGVKNYIKATNAMPAKRGDAEITEPITKGYQAVAQQMEKNNITDEQLANSNEPTFLATLDAKNAAKENAKNAPVAFRATENQKLEATKAQAQDKTNTTMGGMHNSRKELLEGVTNKQHKAGEKNTGKHQEVVTQLNQIYADTKTAVDTELNDLETKVTELFDSGAKIAKAAFENYVAKKLDAYKEDRYGAWYNIGGYGKRIKDAWNGLPKAVEAYFVEGRALFLQKLDGTINTIATLVTQRLNNAKTKITAGRQKVVTFVKNLPADVKKAIKADIDAVQGQFKELENSISDKEAALIDSLATKYSNTLKEVDDSIAEFKKHNRGLLGALKDATIGVWKTIQSIRKTLAEFLSGAFDVILAIITHPIHFLSNLISGVSEGFTNFGANILKHLQTGLMGWLTGAMDGMALQMPEDVFSLKGIFSIASQVLGFTWDKVRMVGVKVIGEPVMKALETGFELVMILREKGIAGLWDYLKEQFADLKETVMDAIMGMIQTQVVQAGIKWIMGLLTPAGAFIKAAMAIIDIVKFFVQRAAQIMELVKAFIEGVKAVASGNVKAISTAIENALGKAIPVVIGFLASLLGISGLAQKVTGIFKKIHQRVENGLIKLWTKIKTLGAGLLSKITGKDKDKGKDKNLKDERTKEQKEKDLAAGIKEGTTYLKGNKHLKKEKIDDTLKDISDKHQLVELKLVVDKHEESGKDLVHIHGKVNPEKDGEKVEVELGESENELAPGTEQKKFGLLLSPSITNRKGTLEGDGQILGKNLADDFPMGTRSDYEAHHIIATSSAKRAPIMKAAAESGYDINRMTNGVFLPSTYELAEKVGRPAHTGKHLNKYFETVFQRLMAMQSEVTNANAKKKPWSEERLIKEIGIIENYLRGRLMDMKDLMKLQKDDRLKPFDPNPKAKTF